LAIQPRHFVLKGHPRDVPIGENYFFSHGASAFYGGLKDFFFQVGLFCLALNKQLTAWCAISLPL
jgi:hypothetical protein